MAEGLFGSNVGSKASQRPKPWVVPAPKPVKAVLPKAASGGAAHFASSTHVPSSLLPKTSSASSSFSAIDWGTGGSSSGGGLVGDITGFIGHLGSDIVHTTMGMPAGIMYMFEHPIAGAEGAVKATWADWSPLFHGDFGQWAHNFFEHPLAPILDVAGLATGGAALAAKVADVAAVGGTAALAAESRAAATASALTPEEFASQYMFHGGPIHPAEGFIKASGKHVTGSPEVHVTSDAGVATRNAAQWQMHGRVVAVSKKWFDANGGAYRNGGTLGHINSDVPISYSFDVPTGPIRDAGSHIYAQYKAQFEASSIGRSNALSDAAVARATSGSAHFGNVGRAVLREHIDTVSKAAGRNYASATAEDIAKATDLTTKDARATRLIQGEGGDQLPRAVKSNPLLRARDQWFEKQANKIAETGLNKKLPNVMKFGDQGTYQRWSHLDKGRRAAAMSGTIVRQLGVMHALGEKLGGMTAVEKFTTIFPKIHDAMYANARTVSKDLIEAPGGLDKLKQQGMALLIDEKHLADSRHAANGKMVSGIDKLTQKVGKAEARIPTAAGHDAALSIGLRNVGKFVTVHHVDDLAMAARDEFGNYKAISNQMAHRVANEAIHGQRVLQDVFQTPVKVWRFAMLGMSPRYFVNNFIGNSIMLMAATDPVSLYRAFKQHVAIKAGADAARAADEANARMAIARMPASVQAHHSALLDKKLATQDALAQATGGINPLDQVLAGEHQGLSRSALSDATAKSKGVSGAFTRATTKIPSMYGPTHRFADLPGRYMAMNYSLMRDAGYQQWLAHFLDKGESHDLAAYHAAEQALKNPATRNTVALQVKHMLGQYHTFTTFEKQLKNNLVPFYSWYRAIADHTRHIVTDEAYKAAVGAAIGMQGAKKQKEMIGQVPDFMLGVVPKGLMPGVLQHLLGSSAGRVAGLNMTSMIPYGTIGDETNMVGAALGGGHLRPGDTIGSALNPLVQSGFEQLSGTSLSTGIPTKPPKGGPIAGTFMGMFGNLPQITMLEDATGNGASSTTSKGKPTLYEKGIQASLSSWLGIPIKQISVPEANDLARKEQGVKKPKHPFLLPAL